MLYLGIFGLRSGQCAYWSYYNPNKFGLLQVLPYFIAVSFYFLPIQFGFKPLTNGIFLLVNFSSFRFLQKRRLLNNFRGPWAFCSRFCGSGKFNIAAPDPPDPEIQCCSSWIRTGGKCHCSLIKQLQHLFIVMELFFLCFITLKMFVTLTVNVMIYNI